MITEFQRNKFNAIIILASAIILQASFQLFAIHLDIARFVVTAWFTFLVFPILITILLGLKTKNMGFQFGKLPRNKILFLTTLIVLLSVAVAGFLPESRIYYADKVPYNNAVLFIIIIYTILYFAEEFFFRGFLIFGLEPCFRKWTLVIQTILFTLFHIGKPSAEIFLSILVGLLFGKIALESKSFIIPFLLHWSLGVAVQIYLLKL